MRARMPTIDAAIITGLIEEFEVLRDLLPPMEEVSESSGVWYRTRIEGAGGHRYEVVAAFQDQMGPLGAQGLAARIIDRWDPACILLVGIAGSFASDVRLGDVIVSQQVFYYDLGKATDTGIRYRPQGYPSSVLLTRQFEALRLDKQAFLRWQEEATQQAMALSRRETPLQSDTSLAALRAHRPAVHFGTMASGSLVIADEEKKNELLALHGKIVGTEMEGAGLMHAAFFHREYPTAAIVVKGVSDPANRTKDELDADGDWRELAKANPVRLALALFRRGKLRPLNTDQYAVDLTPSSPARVREFIPDPAAPGVSFRGFERLVVPKGPLTRLSIAATAAASNDEPLRILAAVAVYHTAGGGLERRRCEGGELQIEQAIVSPSIGLYLMVAGVAHRVSFAIHTSGQPTQAVTPTSTRGPNARQDDSLV
jgi:nucleoside phosphorylase